MEYIVYALIGVIVMQDVIHRVERRDLYNRIMCKDINDYKRITNKPAEPVVSAHQRTINKWRHKEPQP